MNALRGFFLFAVLALAAAVGLLLYGDRAPDETCGRDCDGCSACMSDRGTA